MASVTQVLMRVLVQILRGTTSVPTHLLMDSAAMLKEDSAMSRHRIPVMDSDRTVHRIPDKEEVTSSAAEMKAAKAAMTGGLLKEETKAARTVARVETTLPTAARADKNSNFIIFC